VLFLWRILHFYEYFSVFVKKFLFQGESSYDTIQQRFDNLIFYLWRKESMKRMFAVLVILCAVGSLVFAAGQKGGAAAGGSIVIGVSMPTQSLQRWNQDGANMKKGFEAAGYTVDLQYAGDNEIPRQVEQLENMITRGVKALVIAAIDGSSLTNVLASAKAKGIPVIAYDRLLMNTDAVNYYVSFDNFTVGKFQGLYIESKLNLKSEEGPFNIELVGGAPDDNNAGVFFNGALSVLKPYIDSGKLVVLSGQTSFAQVATPNWSTEEAQKRFENIISSVGYDPADGVKLDAVMCSNDSTSQGVTNALVNAGYTSDNFPVTTGQDCDIASVKNMKAGLQGMSIFKDTRTLAAQTIKMVQAIASGSTVPVNNTTDYNNGVKIVPSFLCDPVAAEAKDIQALLIDSGYYTAAQIQ
jgi:putative multiple sugar transport system substrate-binding protein